MNARTVALYLQYSIIAALEGTSQNPPTRRRAVVCLFRETFSGRTADIDTFFIRVPFPKDPPIAFAVIHP